MQTPRRVVALGFFDGVHIGHQALMAVTRKRAEALHARAAVITFDTHPDQVVRGTPVALLGDVAERRALIGRVTGITDVIVLPFDRQFMQTPWEDFIRSVVQEMGAVHLVMGQDFCCGWRGQGTAARIATWCNGHDIGCDIVDQVTLDGIPVSSTYIRSLVATGDMERATRFLGHPFCLSHTVVHGYRRGRRMGIPTINFPIPDGVVAPKYGVYATRAWLASESYQGVTNVGVRPTFAEDGCVTVETNLLDFAGELYGQEVRIDFLAFLREEARFPTQNALAEQIGRDIDNARRYFRDGGEGT